MKTNYNHVINFVIKQNTLFIFMAMILVSSMASSAFFSQTNLSNLIRQVSGVGIVSMGMLLVIIIGGIDLSVGSVLSLGAILLAIFSQFMPLGAALILSVASGILIGVVSGLLVTEGRLAPFIATLAMMTIARGLSFIFSKGAPVPLNDASSGLLAFGKDYFMGIPYPGLLFFGIALSVFIVLKYNVIGRIIVAIGSNEEAVRLSGIKIKKHHLFVYGFAGAMSALAGIIAVSRTGIGSPILGQGLELDAIAAVVIGGTSLKGGKGSAVNTFLGVLILGMMGNIMNLKDVPAYSQQVIKGVLIILAVLLQRFQTK